MTTKNNQIHDPNHIIPSRPSLIPESLVMELKAFGEPDMENPSPWLNYESFILTDEIAQHLIKIIEGDVDEQFNIDDDEVLCWVPLHAWRILITKMHEPAIPSLIARVTFDDDDDWVESEIPRGLEKFGPVAIRYICDEFRNNTIYPQESFGYGSLIEVLTNIVKGHPDERERVAGFFRELLSQFEVLPPRFNSFVICGSVDLADSSAAPLIQRVFEKKYLDESIIDWDWVRKNLAADQLPSEIKPDRERGEVFQYSGDEKFQKLLKSFGSTFNVPEVKCMMVGSILAVDLVQPSLVASQITADAEEEDGGFQTESQARHFYREFFGLWNELSKYQNEIFLLPEIKLRREFDLKSEEINSLRVFWIKMYLIAFSQGFFLVNEDEQRFSGTPIGDFVEFIEEKITRIDNLEDEKRYSVEAVDAIITEINDFWVRNYLLFAKSCREFRRKEMEKIRFVEEHKHVGRNEPCPCGSGKKFKKCCMVMH